MLLLFIRGGGRAAGSSAQLWRRPPHHLIMIIMPFAPRANCRGRTLYDTDSDPAPASGPTPPPPLALLRLAPPSSASPSLILILKGKRCSRLADNTCIGTQGRPRTQNKNGTTLPLRFPIHRLTLSLHRAFSEQLL